MGSIAVLTTSGDNDPELEPVQSYRHYLYCDACGSFDLEPWKTGERPENDAKRRGLALVALWLTPLLLVPAWNATGIALSLPLLLFFAVAMVLVLLLFAWLWGTNAPAASRWRFVRRAIPWLAALLVAESLSALLPRWQMAAAGAILIALALGTRAVLAGRIEWLGMRCRACGATYGNGTAFFQDLDANPRGLTVSDVPRPLGRSPYRQGRVVRPAPTIRAEP